MPSAAENSKAGGSVEKVSRISCECQQAKGRRRCSASPEPEGREGKENELKTGLDLDSCRVNGNTDKQRPENMECEETSETIFPDDDSNQILPVEQFFGNLDVVQVRLKYILPLMSVQFQLCAYGNEGCFNVVMTPINISKDYKVKTSFSKLYKGEL